MFRAARELQPSKHPFGDRRHRLVRLAYGNMRTMRIRMALRVLVVGVLVGCSPSTPTVAPSVGAQSPGQSSVEPPTSRPSPSPGPTAAVGFAFDAESIAGYYQGLGYACTDPGPSSQAAGYLFRSCQLVDPDGRTRVIGLVTDPDDDLADAFASIQGKAGEAILDPTVALEPLAAFLGATLGPSQGEALLPWLAGHLGDSYTTTTVADLTVATYSQAPDDHSKLFVEIANQGYLEAPRASPAP
jgi:hypothetical protein